MSIKLKDLLLNDRGFVFDAVEGESYQLSPTASRLLHWMQEGESGEEGLLRCLLEAFEVDDHTARRDLDNFLNTITELGWR